MKTMRALNRINRHQQKGATLIYALIVITILIMIGVALSSFALMSLRINQIDATGDKAFYLSDAAIEETLIKLNAIANNAEVKAADWIEAPGEHFYGESKWQTFLSKLDRDVVRGKLSAAESSKILQRALEWEFQKMYTYYLIGSPSSEWLTKDYELIQSDVYVTENNIEYKSMGLSLTDLTLLNQLKLNPADYSGLLNTYSDTGKPEIAVTSKFVSNVCEVTVKANGAYNSTHKPLTLVVVMEPPKYSKSIQSDSMTKQPKRNVLLNQALTAGRNIVVSGPNVGKTSVVGNVYAYGDFPSSTAYTLEDLGGIFVGYSSNSTLWDAGLGPYSENAISGRGRLSITGDLITRSGVQLFGTDSNLEVSGNVYANGLIANRYSDKSVVKIGNDLILMEDLMLNGSDPSLTIGDPNQPLTGTIWGLADLNFTNQFANQKSDMSSSIIINTKSDHPRITCNRVLIGGVAYYNAYRHSDFGNSASSLKAYQTGESMTTNNQSWFYQMLHNQLGVNTSLINYQIDQEGEETKIVALVDALDSNGKPYDDVVFKSNHFFAVGLENTEAVEERDRSILNINSISVLNDNGSLKISGLHNNFGLGVIISNNRVFNPYYVSESTELDQNGQPVQFMTSTQFGLLRSPMVKSFDEKTHLLRTRNLSSMNNTDPVAANANRFNQLVDLNQGNRIDVSDPKDISILNANPNLTIYVNIPESEKSGLTADQIQNGIFVNAIENDPQVGSQPLTKTLKGFIVTKGAVFVYNEGTALTYKGCIASDSNIVFRGSGDKNIIYDEQTIYKWVANDAVIQSALYGDSGRQVNKENGTSSDQGNLSLYVSALTAPDDPKNIVNIAVNKSPVLNGVIKTPSDFSFKIKKWSVD